MTTILPNYDQVDFERNPKKYQLFKTAKVATKIQSCPNLQVGQIVEIEYSGTANAFPFGVGRPVKMPIYLIKDGHGSTLYGAALSHFCL